MMKNMIRCSSIDIAMIVYNEEDIISKSLTSLLERGFDSFVILDMNSTDSTVDMARSILGDKCKIQTISRSYLIENGYAAARNVCGAFCQREWILFVDADEVLTSDISDGYIALSKIGTNETIYSIDRHNLAFDNNSKDIYIKSSEKHNRLYQQKFWQNWKGYIHEEIFVAESSAYRDSGISNLQFDHYSEIKSSKDADLKAGLYALMLLRAYNFPVIRNGTNPWWYENYVPEHLPILTVRAKAFADSANIPQNFYETIDSGRAAMNVSQIMKTFSAELPDELMLNCQNVRTIHSIDCSKWLGFPARGLWYEWDHPGEGSRTLSSIVNAAEVFQWHKFIRPGSVAIDIGGHSGDTAIPMGLFCFDKENNEKGHVIVVEPNPAVIPVLDCNLAINTHIAHFYSLPAAITAEDVDEIELADHGNSQCNGGVLESGLSESVAQKLIDVAVFRYKAPGISMKTLFESAKNLSNNQPIGFVKLDCEGYDKEILRPCKSLFEEDKPTLFVEWFDWFSEEDDHDLFNVISSINYVPFDPVTLERSDVDKPTSDLICLHKSKLHMIE